jgi:hypothetical protein
MWRRFTLGAEAMIEDRSPLKHSVHKVCVPNLHIAHFRKAQDEANLTVRRIVCLASSLRYCPPPQSKQAHRREAIMSRQAAEVGLPESEYLTVPEIAKILLRNRKTVMAGSNLVGLAKWAVFS